MAAVAPATSLLNSYASPPNADASMSNTRKIFGRSRKHAQPSNTQLNTASYDMTDEKVFSSHDSNLSTSALSSASTASRTSRFFRRFARRKPPPVPSLPPALVLDLDAGTAAPRASDTANPIVTRRSDAAGQPSAAAAIIAESNAAYAAAETRPKPKGLQRKRMLDAMANARLDVHNARDLVRMCGVHIRERGLDTPGLFRPFRIAESHDQLLHMIQLFLLSVDPSTYMAVFPILPDNALDSFGRNAPAPAADHHAKASVARDELDKELRYAAPHDVVAVMKWGLRHLRLRCADFDSKDADEWYEVFAAAERAAAYPARAIADLLHPKLPIATAELLSETLDLMASVAAHSSTNHMPAAQICKVLGFWLFGRIGVAHPPPTVDELVDAVNRAAGVAEHLLLAHIRSQAAVTFSMPLRLTELVQSYPHVRPGAQCPSLPAVFAARAVPTLRIDLRSDNMVVSQSKPRTPSATLADALDAQAAYTIQGEHGELWAAVMMQLDHQDASTNASRLLIDEHVRILGLVDKELAVGEEDTNASLASAAAAAATPHAVLADDKKVEAQIKAARRRSQSLSDLRTNLGMVGVAQLAPLPENVPRSSTGTATPRTSDVKLGTPRRKPVPLVDTKLLQEAEAVEVVADNAAPGARVSDEVFSGGLEPSASWRSFSEEGFGGMSTASSELSLSEFDLRPVSATLPSRRSQRGLHRVRSSASGGSRRRTVLPPVELARAQVQARHTVTAARMVEHDTALAIVWQDQLLDASPCCSLPAMLFVQLNKATGAAVAAVQDANEADVPRYPGDTPWLLVVETIIPPRPPTPPAVEKTGWRLDDAASTSDRRSILAPSMRSVKMRLRRVSTIIGNGVAGTRKKHIDTA
ncbi:uncharacterized protein PAN0_018c5656 [Moesziomyces antarcticus]|uniref:Uncharacterized protein n=2 Tax=Pseudozyma antarctica TaxID=84753 RepID=A0A5C3FW89_PSEA2|nr:uncharacterized protein PAN0_018c5656 [Moesziomyces antarcticus]GAK67429.1 conserved hypothetical protein [Moesziomyces antarcticus]SPO48683.1 uncharacterized protein PSANT_06374 [Moesziomyces antarcticus]